MIIEGILITIGVILAIWGLCELLHNLRLISIFKAKNVKLLSVVFLKPNRAVSQLNFAAEQKNWLGGDFAEYIIGVTDGIDGEELKECKHIAENRGIVLCDKQQLSRVADNLVFKL